MRSFIYLLVFSAAASQTLAQQEAARYTPRVTGMDSVLLFYSQTDPNAPNDGQIIQPKRVEIHGDLFSLQFVSLICRFDRLTRLIFNCQCFVGMR